MVMEKELKILFIEDVIMDAELNWREIEKNGIAFKRLLVDNRKDFLEGLKSFNPDLIISDYSLPQFDGMTALLLRNEHAPFTPFILVTGSINEEVAVECMKTGADDYVIKNNLSRLSPAINNALKKIDLLKQKRDAETALCESEERYRLIVEKSPNTIAIHSEGKLVYLNPAGAKLVGAKNVDDLIGRSILDVVHPDSRKNVIERIRQVASGKDAPLFEEKFVKLDGSVIDVEVIGIPTPYLGHLAIQVIVRDITLRKQAEKSLRENEEIFRNFMVYSPIYVFFKDKNIRALRLSNNYSEMLGKPLAELLGKNMNELFPSELAKSMVEDDAMILKEGKMITVEEELNGRYYTTIKFPIKIDETPTYLAGYSIDITDHKKAEEALVESEMKYRQLVSRSPDGIFIVDLSGKFLSVNKTICDNLKYSEQALLSMRIWDIVPEKYQSIQKQRLIDVIKGNSTNISADYEVIGKDGIAYPVEVLSVPYYKGKEIIGFQGIARDVRERRHTEKVLRESEEKYHSIFENIQDLYYESSMDGTIIEVSPSISTLSHGQYKREDLIGKSMYEFYSYPGERDALMKALKTKGIISDFEIHLKNRDGSLIPCSVSSKLTFDEHGSPLKIIGSMRDISERKKSEAELISAKKKAEESDDLKTAFLHNISHEIRTPMNAIVGFSALLGEPGLDSVTQQAYIETIMQSSNHLLAIISDIVDISNIEANLVKTSKNEIDINSFLKSLCNQFQPKALEKGIKLDCESGLENSESLIIADSTKLTQVISNLINNALKFTDKGSVILYLKKVENILHFSVTDTGIGIPHDYHERIFDRFFQVNNTVSRIYEGTGLGLAISKAYVELMDGKIWLSSDPGTGTIFNFTIPYEKQTVALIPKVEKLAPEAFLFKRKIRILVAEDTDSNFKLIKYFLSGSNAEIIRASNGREAVDKTLSERNIDLILMDIKMPVMDGYTAVKLIREANIKTPIIAQTAYLDDRDKAISGGCDGFISKPFDKKKFLEVISEFI
jgi:PAS domain S-box-containing protein